MKWEFEAELALKATSSAGALLADTIVQKISEKDNYKDIVTEFDVATGLQINKILKNSSKFQIINEELTENHLTVSEQEQPFWVVDPIDGTTNFASGMPFYCCSVGLVDKNEFVTGSIYAPKTKELYFTYGDQGSYLNGKLITGAKNISLKQASIAASFSNSFVGANHSRQYEVFGEINDKSRTLLRLGSAALNLAYVCDGRLHGSYGLNAKIWDIGAGLALAKQAGCTVYYHFVNPITVNYVVGSDDVVSGIKEILLKKGLLNGQ